jgi:hypothetical protein
MCTAGVICEPAVGTTENLHGNKPWLRDNYRRLLTPLPEPDDRNGSCFNYTTLRGEDVAFVVDHFELDIRTFVQDEANQHLFSRESFTQK